MEFKISKILTEKGPLKLAELAHALSEPDKKKVRQALQHLRTRYFGRSGVYCIGQRWRVDPDVVADQINPNRFEKRGEFLSHAHWVNTARDRLAGLGYFCFDAQGRRCFNGGDFARADKENAFPVSYYSLKGMPDPIVRMKSETSVGQAGDVVVGKLVALKETSAMVRML